MNVPLGEVLCDSVGKRLSEVVWERLNEEVAEGLDEAVIEGLDEAVIEVLNEAVIEGLGESVIEGLNEAVAEAVSVEQFLMVSVQLIKKYLGSGIGQSNTWFLRLMKGQLGPGSGKAPQSKLLSRFTLISLNIFAHCGKVPNIWLEERSLLVSVQQRFW